MKYNYQISLIISFFLWLFVKSKDVQILNKKLNIDKHSDNFLILPSHNDDPKVSSFKLTQQKLHKCSNECLECFEGICVKCKRGHYAYLHSCYDSCPFDSVADNLDFTCKLTRQNPVYTKAYTFSSCLNACGNAFKDCR